MMLAVFWDFFCSHDHIHENFDEFGDTSTTRPGKAPSFKIFFYHGAHQNALGFLGFFLFT
tara:strand:+ start:528 stop:707 length:180 start_codon:yes stop_codon:yes gene_type:complete